jgi:hypothetical protein
MPSAASSALTFTASPSGPFATGETTGRKPAFQSARSGAASTRSGVPTRPRSGASRAVSSPPSRPEIPIAGTPAAVSPAASALFDVPERTISTTLIASGDVSRRPSTKRDSIRSSFSSRSTARPPPWTRTTGPDARRTSSASGPTRPGSSSAGPPTL